MPDARIPRIRSFNRTVSQIVGALNDHYLGRDRPLGEARVLFEIGREGADVRELRQRLGLDSGYLSRLLRSLEEQGLIRSSASGKDGRVRRAQLTRSGLAETKEYEKRSNRLSESILDPLTETQRERLTVAMADVERLLKTATATIEVEPPDSDAAQWCLGEYFREINQRFEGGFDIAEALPTPLEDMTPPRGAFLIARFSGTPVACAALKRTAPEVAEVKRMWVAPSSRGLGMGRRVLDALEERARAFGLRIIRLETNKTLTEAQALYRRQGYREVAPFNNEPYAHHWFEKRLS